MTTRTAFHCSPEGARERTDPFAESVEKHVPVGRLVAFRPRCLVHASGAFTLRAVKVLSHEATAGWEYKGTRRYNAAIGAHERYSCCATAANNKQTGLPVRTRAGCCVTFTQHRTSVAFKLPGVTGRSRSPARHGRSRWMVDLALRKGGDSDF